MARALTMRIDVRRFHIFIFQWRRRRRLTATLGLDRVVAVDRAVADGGIGRVVRLHPGAHLLGHLGQLGGDPVTLGTGVGPPLRSRR